MELHHSCMHFFKTKILIDTSLCSLCYFSNKISCLWGVLFCLKSLAGNIKHFAWADGQCGHFKNGNTYMNLIRKWFDRHFLHDLYFFLEKISRAVIEFRNNISNSVGGHWLPWLMTFFTRIPPPPKKCGVTCHMTLWNL